MLWTRQGCAAVSGRRQRGASPTMWCSSAIPTIPRGYPLKRKRLSSWQILVSGWGLTWQWMNASAIFWIIQNYILSYLTWPGLRICLSLRHLQSCMPWPGCGWATAFAATAAFWSGFRQYASPGPCPARPSAPAWRPLERRILRSTPERCLRVSGRGFLPPSMTWAFRYIHPRPIICSFGTGKRTESWKKAGFTRSCWAGAS